MRSPSSTKSVVRNGKKSARKKWRTSTKSVVRNGKKPREKNGVKKTLGAKSELVSPGFRVVIFSLQIIYGHARRAKEGLLVVCMWQL